MNPRSRNSGKVYDPVFLFMLLAVLLAVGSSMALRAVVSGVGPAAARADDSVPEDPGFTHRPTPKIARAAKNLSAQ